MDFHKAFEDSLQTFPQIEGIIFVDPDGESIAFESPGLSTFNIRLAGAKMNLLVKTFEIGTQISDPQHIEIKAKNRRIFYVNLNQSYSITAIFREDKNHFRVKQHLLKLAKAFNQDII